MGVPLGRLQRPVPKPGLRAMPHTRPGPWGQGSGLAERAGQSRPGRTPRLLGTNTGRAEATGQDSPGGTWQGRPSSGWRSRRRQTSRCWVMASLLLLGGRPGSPWLPSRARPAPVLGSLPAPTLCPGWSCCVHLVPSTSPARPGGARGAQGRALPAPNPRCFPRCFCLGLDLTAQPSSHCPSIPWPALPRCPACPGHCPATVRTHRPLLCVGLSFGRSVLACWCSALCTGHLCAAASQQGAVPGQALQQDAPAFSPCHGVTEPRTLRLLSSIFSVLKSHLIPWMTLAPQWRAQPSPWPASLTRLG